jgi:hypothetical protein
MAVAAYVAKYATKTADSAGVLARRVRTASEIGQLSITHHQRRLVETAWRLAAHPGLSELGLRRCAHAFGYRGHVVTKSRQYSTTFSALRSARAEYRRNTGTDLSDEEVPVRFGYAGRGYDDPDTGLLAFHLARLATQPGGGRET